MIQTGVGEYSYVTSLRVEVYPHDVEPDEFNIVIKTWDETVLYGVWITWIAHD